MDFTNAWEFIFKKVDIARINVYHTTIMMFPYITLPLECAGYLMNNMLVALDQVFHVCGFGYAHSQLNPMGVNDSKTNSYHAITQMGL